MNPELLVGLFGILTGCLSGLLGIGGGILLAPLLIIFMPLISSVQFTLLTITGLTTAQSFFGSSSAMLHLAKSKMQDNTLIYRFGIPMGLASLAISFFALHIPEQVVLIVFSLLAICSVLIALLDRTLEKYFSDINLKRTPALPVIGISLGLLCGAVGQGGGFIYLPIMIYVFRCSPKVAIASAPIIGVLSSISLFSGRALSDTLDWWLCLYLVIGIFIGAKIGALASLRLNETILKKCINVFIFLSSLKIISMAL
ncbi:sulfite exporter TauE/SafE family protein [Pseudoalteromonas luteoviolacea]|uniref:sulfite exporter TauE/SafE family protein n=1 Tax=Pseudoalteromonas luteoviolacea TaxID=43657 RepID=UPI001F2D68EE|nr:sulfite exporter TauE/SafE family protein [Pseudoalteromonas luteoviolacea]MCF6438422.1 sulfite exporter TauE/SafE family protein [Pseudoalteromonas luteoviolacea]